MVDPGKIEVSTRVKVCWGNVEVSVRTRVDVWTEIEVVRYIDVSVRVKVRLFWYVDVSVRVKVRFWVETKVV